MKWNENVNPVRVKINKCWSSKFTQGSGSGDILTGLCTSSHSEVLDSINFPSMNSLVVGCGGEILHSAFGLWVYDRCTTCNATRCTIYILKNETPALNSPLRRSSTCGQFWVGAGDKADESLKWTNALVLNSYCKCLSTFFKLLDVDNFWPNLDPNQYRVVQRLVWNIWITQFS